MPAAPTTPVSPTFAELGLPAPLVAVLTRRGMIAPFAIQAAALPDALAGHDVLGRAQTGSGKTLAFGLPLLVRTQGERLQARRPLALVLVPTRELAFQVVDALAPLGHALGVSVTSVVGGAPFGKQVTALSRGVAIVVATPGRLEDHLRQGTIVLDDVQSAVLDEADHMCDLGFLPAVRRILDLIPAGGQRMLFSATLDGAVQTIVDGYLADPVTHSTASVGEPVADMDHHVLVLQPRDKGDVTAQIAARAGRTIAFVRTQHGADRLARQLTQVGVGADSLHGGKTQAQRNKALDAFKQGRFNVLVATDVAARGIHVDDVDLVLHVDAPADHKDYLHRAGRTARAGSSGTVVTLTLAKDERSVSSLLRRAGVEALTTRITPGSAVLTQITGAAAVPGQPWIAPTPAPSERPRSRRPDADRDRQPRRPATAGRPTAGRPTTSRPTASRASTAPSTPVTAESARPPRHERRAGLQWSAETRRSRGDAPARPTAGKSSVGKRVAARPTGAKSAGASSHAGKRSAATGRPAGAPARRGGRPTTSR